jgi:asparagine synthase (glutamine-hydrolysing)
VHRQAEARWKFVREGSDARLTQPNDGNRQRTTIVQGMITEFQPELSGAQENGILPASWSGWSERHAAEGVVLYLEGFAAPESAQGDSARAIIELYRRKGAAFVKSLRGYFALALWDSRQKKLFLATDHFGTRSLYYWVAAGRIAFAPRMAKLTDAQEVERTIDPNSIYFFLNHSFIPAPFTIYKKVRRLEPGHLLVWSGGQVTLQKYWDMTYEEDLSLTEAEAADSLRSSLQDSVGFALARRECRDGQIGAFLSGGTDSSTLVGLLSQAHPERVKSFSVGFEEAAYNEIHYARIAAKHFRSQSYEYFVRPDEALDAVHNLAAVYDEPFGNSSAIPTFFCLKMARQAGVNVMFAGDGGDELYGGNDRYVTERLFTLYQRIPRVARLALDQAVARIPGFYPWRKVKNYVQKANQSPAERFFAYQLYFRNHAADYFSDSFAASIDREFPLELPKQRYAEAGNVAALNRLLYVDLKLAVADNDLFKVNRMAEIHGIQVLYPYLDPKVGLASGRIPADLKIKGWAKRYIFKKAFSDFLPVEILEKKKHGFGLPTGDWLRQHNGFRELARSLLLDRHSQRGYFRRPALERLLMLHDQETSSYYGSQIWNLMMLELWHRNFADHENRANESTGIFQ